MHSQLIRQLREWEPHIHSFVQLCPAVVKNQYDGDNQITGICSDISVGVKDIIDVAGMATKNGSQVYCDVKPAVKDAIVVAALRGAGASIIGKTTTTEFAFTDPTDCRNPYDLRRSPGGSSSGSGAAVAAGLVDIALGTQTAGSLCRPAAYCGVVGFKPTYGLLPTDGVTPLATSFDTVGVIAQSVELASKAFNALVAPATFNDRKTLSIASALLPTKVNATSDTLDAFAESSLVLKQAGYTVFNMALDAMIDDIVASHRTVMNAEAVRAHGHLLSPETIDLLQPQFRAGLEAGATVSDLAYNDALGFLEGAVKHFWAQLKGVDIILSLPVPEGAPLMDGTTGFQDWLTPWTVFGGPLLCLPWGLDAFNRPRSIMLAAFPGEDRKLLAIAGHLERYAPALTHPISPGR